MARPDLSDRNDEMFRLRIRRWTLKRIGEKFGVSRERVRQILGNGTPRGQKYPDTLHNQEYLKSTSHLTNDQLAILHGLSVARISEYRNQKWNGVRYITAGDDTTPVVVGTKWEDWALIKIGLRGYEARFMPRHHPFDILVNDIVRVDIKSAETPVSAPSIKTIDPIYRFNVGGEEKRKDCDLYLCILADNVEEMFFIPAKKIKPKQETINFTWPGTQYRKKSWRDYNNRWDILDQLIEEAQND